MLAQGTDNLSGWIPANSMCPVLGNSCTRKLQWWETVATITVNSGVMVRCGHLVGIPPSAVSSRGETICELLLLCLILSTSTFKDVPKMHELTSI